MTMNPSSHTEPLSTPLSIDKHPDIQALADRFTPRGREFAVAGATGIALLAGVYAAMSSWVVGFHAQSALAVSDLIVGAAVAAIAIAMLRDSRLNLGAVYGLLGVWLIVAPWSVHALDRTTGMVASNLAAGIVVTLAGLAAMAVRLERRRARR